MEPIPPNRINLYGIIHDNSNSLIYHYTLNTHTHIYIHTHTFNRQLLNEEISQFSERKLA